MSKEEIAALLARLKEDTELMEKLQGAGDLDAAEALVKEVGFDVSKADWLKYQENLSIELADEELEAVAGGRSKKKCGEGGNWRNSVTGSLNPKLCVQS